jgi:hypothetical protein
MFLFQADFFEAALRDYSLPPLLYGATCKLFLFALWCRR